MHKIVESAKEITPERLAELKANAAELLAQARAKVVSYHPFVGSIAMAMDVVPVRDVRVQTACTDGKTIYFDIDFLSSLTPDQRDFVFGHEVWHAVLMHLVRLEGRDMSLFNIATDMEVNNILREDGFQAPKMVIFPETYHFEKGLAAEEYYELLLEKQEEQEKQSNGKSGSGQPTKNGKSGQGGAIEGQFDQHAYEGEEISDGSEGKCIADKYGKVGLDKDFNPAPSRKAAEQIREAAVSAAQQIERQRGELPAHLAGIVNKLLTPEIPWQEVLARFVNRAYGEKRTWNRPNRRFAYSGTYLPSTFGEKIKIAIGIDTSGSCTQDAPKFLGEINDLVKTFGDYELTIIQCDAEVQKVDTYNQENPLDLEHIEFETHGGGGTMMKPIFDYIQLNDVPCDAVCIFTDGYIESQPAESAPEVPVLWMITSDGNTSGIEFGEITKFKAKRD